MKKNILVLLSLLLAGCGQYGPLYLAPAQPVKPHPKKHVKKHHHSGQSEKQ